MILKRIKRFWKSRNSARWRGQAMKVSVGVMATLMISGCRAPSPQGATASAGTPKPLLDGTHEMAGLLQATAREIQPQDLPFLMNEERAKSIYAEMEKTPDLNRKGELWLRCAVELLNAGKTETSLEALGALEKHVKRNDPVLWDAVHYTVRTWQAIGNLRLAEQQNCCAANTSDSCLLPIRGQGLHTRKAGSTRAIQLFEELLRERPNDLQARWLLNIAAMTLGKYPGGVAEKWRIPPQAFQSDYALKRFTNVAPRVGINLLGRSGGCVVDDFNGDGKLDIVVSAIGFQDQMQFFQNNGDGTFTDKTKESGLMGETGGLNMVQADYDNDGHLDILLLRGGWMGKAGRFPASLLHGNGDGTFTDVTRQAGVFRIGPTQAAAWMDYNSDGHLDLFVGYESGTGGTYPCALYRNNNNGTFTEVAREAGVDFVGFVKAVVSADYDNDNRPDLFLTMGGQAGGKNVLFHNNGNGTFTNVAEKAGLTNLDFSFSTFFFDYDNDGWEDLFVVGYRPCGLEAIAAAYLNLPTTAERSHLYHNNRDGTFRDVSQEVHLDKVILGMGINYGDLDNDGYLDFYVGTGNPYLNLVVPNRMFRNESGRFFQDVTTSGNFGHLQKGHAIAFADINDDGNQDVFAQMGGANYGDVAYSALFANPGHDNHWVALLLEGTQTNRCAIGARIKVTVRTGQGSREIHRTVRSGGSFGANPLRQEIGLGKAEAIEKVEVLWPVSGKTQTLLDVKRDQFYKVREGEDKATLISRKAFSWP